MLHNIENEIYHCEYTPRKPDFAKDYIVVYSEEKLLLHSSPARIPLISDISECGTDIDEKDLQFLFTVSGRALYLYSKALPEYCGYKYCGTQEMRSMGPRWMAFAGITAYHLSYWYSHNRFCGVCGTKNGHSDTERALICPECGNIKYPDIAIAIIVGITHNGQILLSKYSHGVHRRYALIAGFNEIGEALEDTVRREIFEEVGLRVKNIRYYDNQPWGISRSLLVGFFAELDGSDAITLDNNELSEAIWVPRGEVPEAVADISLTSKIMEAFRTGEIEK